jgi:hypothetical protein
MRIKELTIHNFRGIIQEKFRLENYSLLVGSNNAGKSTVIDAIRAFYEKDKYQYQDAMDFPKAGATDNESWIEIVYSLTDAEYDSLADDYKYEHGKLYVKKYFKTDKRVDGKSLKGIIVGKRTNGSFSNDHFYGAKNVQSGKLGNIIYIPAVSKVDEITKMSGPSALRELLQSIMSCVVEGSDSYAKLTDNINLFSSDIKSVKTDDSRSFSGLETEINSLLSPWEVAFEVRFQAPSPNEIIKSMIKWDLIDKSLESIQDIDKFGSGFQRHFIFSIIKLANDYMPKTKSIRKNDFSPDMNMLLFEEPEAFLHPTQQQQLCRDLISLSNMDTWQVLITTHSSHFVSRSVPLISSIIHLVRIGGTIDSYQIDENGWKEIVDANLAINSLSKRYKKLAEKLRQEDSFPEVQLMKYFLILNAERADAFFSSHTILVEGQSEVALIRRILEDQKLPCAEGIYVFDCMGKFNMPRFMNLFGNLGISHSVIYDDDQNKTGEDLKMQTDCNELINASRNQFTTCIESIAGNLELFLGIDTNSRSDKKAQIVLYSYDTGAIQQDRINDYISIIKKCLPNRSEAMS